MYSLPQKGKAALTLLTDLVTDFTNRFPPYGAETRLCAKFRRKLHCF